MRMAPPTAIPPRTREKTKTAKLVVSADRRAEHVKKTAVAIRTFFRPKRSLKKPATAVPPSAPQPRQLTAKPSNQSPRSPVSLKYFWMKGTAPEITVASKPQTKPPSATTSATSTVNLLL